MGLEDDTDDVEGLVMPGEAGVFEYLEAVLGGRGGALRRAALQGVCDVVQEAWSRGRLDDTRVARFREALDSAVAWHESLPAAQVLEVPPSVRALQQLAALLAAPAAQMEAWDDEAPKQWPLLVKWEPAKLAGWLKRLCGQGSSFFGGPKAHKAGEALARRLLST